MRLKNKSAKAGRQALPEHGIIEHISHSPLAGTPLVQSFLNKNLDLYLETPRGKSDLSRLMSDPGLFGNYLEVLRSKGAIKLMADFLMSKKGIDVFVEVCQSREGLRLMIKIGQTDEGRAVARKMLLSPIRGWPAIAKILQGIGETTKNLTENASEPLPSFDFFGYRSVEKMQGLLSDPSLISPIFISFSQSREDARFCGRILMDKVARGILFDYLKEDPDRTMGHFNRLFRSQERRRNISRIFISRGGTELLCELAADPCGRQMLIELAMTPNGRSAGLKALVMNPLMAIKVGKAYFFKTESQHET